MIELTIDGMSASTHDVTFSEWGGLKLSGAPVAPFVLAVPYQLFRGRFTPTYEAAIADLKSDDEMTGVFDPPYTGAKGYPSLDELFALPPAQRMEMVEAFFVFDLLKLFFEEEKPRARWIVRRFDDIQRDGDLVDMSGRVEKLASRS